VALGKKRRKSNLTIALWLRLDKNGTDFHQAIVAGAVSAELFGDWRRPKVVLGAGDSQDLAPAMAFEIPLRTDALEREQPLY
jgi:hypothetical protein